MLAFSLSVAHAATTSSKSLKALKPYFEEAANEFFVPEKLIEGIAFTESRWVQRIPTDFDGTEADERPKAYGVMGLRSDEWFGHSLDSAAKLIHEPRQNLILEARANIRGATALLAEIARDQIAQGASIEMDAATPRQKELVSWATVIALYSGIHSSSSTSQTQGSPLDSDEAQLYVRDVLKAAGDSSYHLFKDITSDGPSLDYSGAVWSPSPNFTSAADSSQYIVIHVTDGSFAGALSWLKNPESKASAHYLVRSSDGQVVQLVAEADIAWHVRCWNPMAIGIEHEGFTSTGEDLTEEMYQSSAKLVANIAARKGIPVDSNHIIGHNYWQTPAFKNQTTLGNCNDHVDPGTYWNWDHYFSLIRSELSSQTNHGAY
jgi:N-acetylmuramoyl-L-alanine amidase